MNYQEWEESVPQAISGDLLWEVKVYRLALFACEIGWQDATKLTQDRRTISLADQLYRALGSISVNIAEGYSRSSGKDRVRFYEYSLGSARESRDWYYQARHSLTEEVASHRLQLLSEIIRLLLVMIPDQRTHYIKEEPEEYQA